MTIEVDDLTVEVRDETLKIVGQVTPESLPGALFINRYNNTGSWQLTLAYDDPMAELLRTPGYGIRVLLGPANETLISGPTMSAQLTQTPEDVRGKWLIEGASDDIVLQERLAYPDPSEPDVSAQTVSHDRRSGKAETVIKGYVDDNAGPSAPSVRQVPGLIVEADTALGPDVDTAARFNTLQELIYGIAESANLGYTVKQVADDLVFSVFEPTDRSATIRMDIENDQIQQVEYGYGAPKTTRAIVAGQGEAVERLFIERTSTESLAAESLWNRRIEVFQDARQAETTDELNQAGDENLAENGKTIVSLEVVPSDNVTMVYGRDWFLGDVVTLVSGTIETVATVTEVGVSIADDGVRIATVVGSPELRDFDSRLVSKVTKTEERVSSLERNTTGYGIKTDFAVAGGTDGDQPTFSGPVFIATYTRFGNMVHFAYDVDFDNITSFGTGQYFMTLPYNAARNYLFRDGCLHDISAGLQYHISGHVNMGTNVMTLFTTGITGQRIYDDPFTSTEPVTLSTADNFHIAGTYEIEV
jgi:hypothetical protein